MVCMGHLLDWVWLRFWIVEMLDLSERGDNSSVDMLVGDICKPFWTPCDCRAEMCLDGSDYSKVGLKSSTIASSFGKVFRQGAQKQKKAFAREDISRSLLYAISNNIGQIAYGFSDPGMLYC